MATVTKPISNIAVAFAASAKSNAVGAEPHAGPVSAAHGGASSDGFSARDPGLHTNPHTHTHRAMLLTPPNSISPTIPPHRHVEGDHRVHHPNINTKLAPTSDSDLDLNQRSTTPPNGATAPLSSSALASLTTTHTITPQLLATTHLPPLLLSSGPLAIRHILAHLTQSLPGFSRIPPAKARRLVVAALESRSPSDANNNNTSYPHDKHPHLPTDVIFEKVGWGRWDARHRGQPPRDRVVYQGSVPIAGVAAPSRGASELSPPPSFTGSYALSSVGAGLQIPRACFGGRGAPYVGSWMSDRSRGTEEPDLDGAATGGWSPAHDGGGVIEEEADKMSLDGSESSVPEEEDDATPDADLEMDDQTDEEDWAGMGAEVLRKASVTGGGGGLGGPGGYRSLAKSAPGLGVGMLPHHHRHTPHHPFQHRPNPDARVEAAQEREAVEALLRMGSM